MQISHLSKERNLRRMDGGELIEDDIMTWITTGRALVMTRLLDPCRRREFGGTPPKRGIKKRIYYE
jgi:hypothetical protein